jgi:hypothetical protein
MSALLLQGSGLLVMIVGWWFAWRTRRRLVDKRVPSPGTMLGMAVIFLGASIGFLGGVRTDGWSTTNWLSGIGFIWPVFATGVFTGMALEMRRQPKAASGGAQPPI